MGKKIQLTESDLKKLVKESVKRIINEMYANELRSSTYANAGKKMQKYGMYGDEAGKFGEDKYGNPLYKDGRPVAKHLIDLDNAYKDAKEREDLENPITRKAQELYDTLGDSDFDIETADDWVDDYTVGLSLHAEAEDEDGGVWNFDGYGYGSGRGEIDEIEEMEYTAPDGTTGDIPRP